MIRGVHICVIISGSLSLSMHVNPPRNMDNVPFYFFNLYLLI